jgi:hypothetical protein
MGNDVTTELIAIEVLAAWVSENPPNNSDLARAIGLSNTAIANFRSSGTAGSKVQRYLSKAFSEANGMSAREFVEQRLSDLKATANQGPVADPIAEDPSTPRECAEQEPTKSSVTQGPSPSTTEPLEIVVALGDSDSRSSNVLAKGFGHDHWLIPETLFESVKVELEAIPEDESGPNPLKVSLSSLRNSVEISDSALLRQIAGALRHWRLASGSRGYLRGVSNRDVRGQLVVPEEDEHADVVHVSGVLADALESLALHTSVICPARWLTKEVPR